MENPHNSQKPNVCVCVCVCVCQRPLGVPELSVGINYKPIATMVECYWLQLGIQHNNPTTAHK